MMTPFDIEERVAEIRRARQIDGRLAELMEIRLVFEVMQEIAGGCLDPRSMAIAVMKLK
jgi:hypothetical protein